MSITSPRHPFGLFLWAFSALVFVYLIGPLVVIAASSFGATGYLVFPPQGFSLKAYEMALANPRYLQGFFTSVKIAGIVAALATVIGVPAAYALVRWNFRGAKAVEALFLSPLVLPGLVLAVALTIFFSRQRLVTGTDRLILAHLALCVPCVMRVAIPVLQRFDRALEEAAMNLGATPVAAFFLVTLPAIKAGVAAAFVLAFIMSFDEVEMAIFLASPREAPLTAVLFAQAQYSFDPSLAAVSALLILAVFLVMLAIQLAEPRPDRAMTAEVELRDLVKAYGAVRAVDGVSLQVAKGELVALLGPSGCGKTTTLRAIAGFVEPTSGVVLMRGEDITRKPPHKRDAGMVFQSYALFPHLSVRENLAFGLKRRGVEKSEIARRTGDMLALLKLDGLAERLPRELSGGQQQRVAVGRALVINPTVLLLDEPFSNLDALLRETTRVELRRLQQELGLTAILVTHDQAEAMAIADRIAIMNKGRIVQIDAPEALYRRPATRFVASFVGRANLLEARLRARDGADAILDAEGVTLRLPAAEVRGDHGFAVLRPEIVSLEGGTAAPAENAVAGTVELVSFLGAVAQVVVAIARGRRLIVEGPGDLARRFPPGAPVVARWDAAALTFCQPD